MGIELVSACVFCAGMLLGMDLPPRPGLGAELGFSYSTLARRYDIGTTVDTSDVTPKFVLVGMGFARFAPDGLGAGTPEFEWRGRVAFGTSHDEQQRLVQPELGLPRVVSNGTGRAENFALLLRLPVTKADSVELAGEGRNNRSTDIINIGGENQEVTEARDLSSQRIDVAAGWRHRWTGLEAAGGLPVDEALGLQRDGRILPGCLGPDSRAARARCAGSPARGRSWPTPNTWAGTSTSIARAFRTSTTGTRSSRRPSRRYRLSAGYSWTCSDLMLSATYDRQKLPFVSLAVLGTETVAFDRGYDPNSDNEEVFWDIAFRYAFSPAIRAPRRRPAGLGRRDRDADGLRRSPPDPGSRRGAPGHFRRKPFRSAGIAGVRLLHRGGLLDRRAESLSAARVLNSKTGEDLLNPPDSDLIYDWNRAGGAVFPARGRVELDDETLRDGLQSPVGQEPLDRAEDPDPPPDGGARHRLGRHRPARAPGPTSSTTVTRLAQEIVDGEAEDPAQLRGAHRRGRHPADHRDLAEGRHPDRGVVLHRLLADPAVRRGLGPRPDAPAVGGRGVPRRPRRAPGHVRHRGHDARAPGPRPRAVHDGDRARAPGASASATRSGTRRRTACATSSRSSASSSRRSTRTVKVDWHGHQDRGLGVTNALWALEAGAHRVHACALGIGERVGNTPMDQLLVNLQLLGWIDRDLTRLHDYCAAVSEATGVPDPRQLPDRRPRRVPHRHRRPRRGHHQGAQEGRRVARRPRLLGRARRRWSAATRSSRSGR